MRTAHLTLTWFWLACGAVFAQNTDLVEWYVSADTATSRVGLGFPEGAAAIESPIGGSVQGLLTFALPPGIGLNALDTGHGGEILFVPDTWVSLPMGGGTVGPRDVVAFDGSTFSVVFEGESEGIPDGVEISALAASPLGTFLVLSFDSRLQLANEIHLGPQRAELWSRDTQSFIGEGPGVLEEPGTLRITALATPLGIGMLFMAYDGDGAAGGTPFDANDLFRIENGVAVLAVDAGADPGWGDAELRDVAVRTRGIFSDDFEWGTTGNWIFY